MNRILYICFGTVLIALLLYGCSKALTTDEWENLKYVADNYTLEDAKDADYVVIENGSVTFGKDIWQDFVDLSGKKKPCKIRVSHYYTFVSPSHYDSELYESMKDDYPKIYTFELEYKDETFYLSHYEEERFYQSEYKYLMRYEGMAESYNAKYTSYVRYVLVNDDTVSWKDIMHGMLSSQSGAYIAHNQIYAELFFKEEGK